MCLPLKLAKSLGNIDQIVICNRVTTAIQLINPQTLQGEPIVTQPTHTVSKLMYGYSCFDDMVSLQTKVLTSCFVKKQIN